MPDRAEWLRALAATCRRMRARDAAPARRPAAGAAAARTAPGPGRTRACVLRQHAQRLDELEGRLRLAGARAPGARHAAGSRPRTRCCCALARAAASRRRALRLDAAEPRPRRAACRVSLAGSAASVRARRARAARGQPARDARARLCDRHRRRRQGAAGRRAAAAGRPRHGAAGARPHHRRGARAVERGGPAARGGRSNDAGARLRRGAACQLRAARACWRWRAPAQFAPAPAPTAARPAAREPRARRHRHARSRRRRRRHPARCSFNGHRARCCETAAGWVAVVGIPLDTKPGPQTASCSPTAGRGTRARFHGGRQEVRRAAPEGRQPAPRGPATRTTSSASTAERKRIDAALGNFSADRVPELRMQPPVAGHALEQLRPAALLQRPAAQPAQRHGHRRPDRHADPEPGARPVIDTGDYLLQRQHGVRRPRPGRGDDVLPPEPHRRESRRRGRHRRDARPGRRHRPRDRPAPALGRRGEPRDGGSGAVPANSGRASGQRTVESRLAPHRAARVRLSAVR